MSSFKVGDKVVCIETDKQACWVNRIEFGAVYFVIEVFEGLGSHMVRVDGGQSVYAKRFKLYEDKEMEQTAEQIRKEILRMDARIEEAKKDIEEAEKKRESLIGQLREKGFLLYGKEGASLCGTPLSVEDVRVGDHLILTGTSRNYLIREGNIVSVEVNDKSSLPFYVRCLSTCEADWVRLEDVKRA